MPPKINSESPWDKVKWIVPPVVAALLSFGVSWSATVTKDINDLKLADAHYDGDLAVVNTKIDLLMKALDVEYHGPAFHAHNQGKE